MYINSTFTVFYHVFFERGDERERNKIRRIRVKAVWSFIIFPTPWPWMSVPTLVKFWRCFLKGTKQIVSGQGDTKKQLMVASTKNWGELSEHMHNQCWMQQLPQSSPPLPSKQWWEDSAPWPLILIWGSSSTTGTRSSPYSKVQKQSAYAFKAPNLKLSSLNFEQTANYH